MVAPGPYCALKDYATHTHEEPHSSIVFPTLDANNFELKPILLSMVPRNQIFGLLIDDLNQHLSIFIEFCDNLKIDGASNEAIQLWLFSLSLRDKAKAWIYSFLSDSYNYHDFLITDPYILCLGR